MNTILTEGILLWPVGVPRTTERVKGTFNTKFAAAYQSLLRELKLLSGVRAVVSGNLAIRGDGFASGDQRTPSDPGIAARFLRKKADGWFVVAVDRYSTLSANMRAVALVVESLRTIERHGNAFLLAQAIEGFRALEPGRVLALPAAAWWRRLGLVERPATVRDLRKAFRRFKHPDHGGDDDVYRDAAAAYAEGLSTFGGAGG